MMSRFMTTFNRFTTKKKLKKDMLVVQKEERQECQRIREIQQNHPSLTYLIILPGILTTPISILGCISLFKLSKLK